MSDSKEQFAIPALPKKQPQKQQQPVVAATATTEEAKENPSGLPPIPKLNYEEPSWGGVASFNYRLEVLKNGQSIETVQGPKKEFVTIGRLPICDILMEHPSISRYQAVIQFDQDGDAYLYDMDSAHGTKLNKKSIPGREYMPLKPGDQIRFGESTRICIFDSEKPYDPEAENEERKQIALRQRIAKERGERVSSSQTDSSVSEGISWGFGEDAEEEDEEDDDVDDETEHTQQDIAASLNQSLVGDANLLNVEAEKMAFEDAKRRREDLEIMYGDDSDEELYDKTRKKNKKAVEKADTHDDLVMKQKNTAALIEKLEAEIKEKKIAATQEENEKEEDLDSYMNHLAKKPLQNEKSLFALQKELNQLKKDNDRFIKLVKLTKPSHIL